MARWQEGGAHAAADVDADADAGTERQMCRALVCNEAARTEGPACGYSTTSTYGHAHAGVLAWRRPMENDDRKQQARTRKQASVAAQSVVSSPGAGRGSPNHGAAWPAAACVARPDVVAGLGGGSGPLSACPGCRPNACSAASTKLAGRIR
ncbi:hypothetical protein VTN96DRAFT_4651 [Rasamsonia emersonii]